MKSFCCAFLTVIVCHSALAGEPVSVWPGLAPGETTRLTGEKLPARPEEVPTVTRVVQITSPTFTVHKPENPNGVGVLILPGGGFSKVVPDKEGTEAADWLNSLGITAFVLSYRTTDDPQTPGWVKPLQDSQRAISLIRSRADDWGVNRDKIGLVAFSAGGQVGTRLLCDGGRKTYSQIDAIDEVSHRPNFAVLVYPWNILDAKTGTLAQGIVVPQNSPPTFLVHTHDDRSSSVGAALYYIALKQHGVPAELHVYGNGGHGYGLRPVPGSQISSWPGHAAHWLGTLGLVSK